MPSRLLAAPAALLLLAACGAASAQGRVDPDAVQAAREMLTTLNFDAQVAATAEHVSTAMMTAAIQNLEQQGESVPPGLEAEIRRLVREHNGEVLAALRPHALDDAARIYARHFSAAEIRELHRLNTNPVMVKFQRIAPQFVAELAQIGMAESARRAPEVRRRIEEAVRIWREREARHGRSPGT